MATIYSIKGTDSISSSRLNINDNFTNLNTSLVEIHDFFTVASQDLTITGALAAATGTFTGVVAVGGTLTVTGVTTTVDTIIAGKYIKTGINAAALTLPTAGQFTKSVYQVTGATGAGTSVGLANGENGQEILIKAVGTVGHTVKITPITANITNVGTNIILTVGTIGKDTVLLRFLGTKWDIVSYGLATVV